MLFNIILPCYWHRPPQWSSSGYSGALVNWSRINLASEKIGWCFRWWCLVLVLSRNDGKANLTAHLCRTEILLKTGVGPNKTRKASRGVLTSAKAGLDSNQPYQKLAEIPIHVLYYEMTLKMTSDYHQNLTTPRTPHPLCSVKFSAESIQKFFRYLANRTHR